MFLNQSLDFLAINLNSNKKYATNRIPGLTFCKNELALFFVLKKVPKTIMHLQEDSLCLIVKLLTVTVANTYIFF